MLELLYEDRDVKVLSRRGASIAAVTFSALPDGPQPEPFGDRLLLKSGLTTIHMLAKRDHWWQSLERNAATAAVRGFLQGHADRVTFGTSMGGYGALSWAGDVGATRIVAIAPQTMLRGRMMPAWQRAIEVSGVHRDEVEADMPADVVPLILYDPLSAIDHHHAQWLGARRKIVCVTAPGTGHRVLAGLRQRGFGSDLVANILNGKMTADDLQAKIDHSCVVT